MLRLYLAQSGVMMTTMLGFYLQGGRIGVVGVYSGYTNHYNIGAFMEKGLTMAAGQVCFVFQ